MGYLGNTPGDKFLTLNSQQITGTGSDTYVLDYAVSSSSDIAVFVNNVRQNVNSYTASNTTLTLGGTISASDECWVHFLGKSIGTQSPAVGSVTNDMLAGSIANAKLANSSITLNGSAVSLGGSASVGKILQVVGTTITSDQSGAAGSDVMISNYVAQITPSSTSSKIWVMFSGPAQVADSNSAPYNCAFKLRINTGSAATTGSTDYQQVRFGAYDYNSAGGTVEEHGVLAFNYLHSPSTTSAVHFGISVNNYDGAPTWRLGIGGFKSHFILMEVQG